jgi:multidrug resistance efflux pump
MAVKVSLEIRLEMAMSRALLIAIFVCGCVAASDVFAQDVQRIKAHKTFVKVLRETEIAMEVAGTLKTVVPTEEGHFVKKGELLAAVNDEVIKAEVEAADFEAEMLKIEIEFAKIAVENTKLDLMAKQDANKNGLEAYSPSELRQAQLEYEKAKAGLEKSKLEQTAKELSAKVKHAELKRYSAFAPHDGCVTDLKMFPGQSPRQGDAVLTLTDLSVLEAEVQIPFQYRDLLHLGDEVEIRPSGSERAAAAAGEVQQASAQISNDDEPLFKASSEDEPLFQPIRPDESPAVVPALGETSQEVFIGKIKFIKPVALQTQNQTYIVLSVHVPNPRDSEGRYRLQSGMPVEAVVLSTPRSKTTSLQK